MEGAARILVAGDTASVEQAEAMLVEAGHRIRTAADGVAAIAALERESADVVLAGWRMPGLDGPQLCRWIRRRPRLAGTHVIVVTARDNGEGPAQALEAGADDYLVEPFDSAELGARLRLGLRGAQLRANEARFGALIANLPGAVYRCANDPDWTMEVISDEIERISGYPADDFIANRNRTFASVIHPSDREDVAGTVAEAVARESPFALEYRIVRADGGVRWVLERGQMVDGIDGRTWLDGAIFDITERRQLEQAQREREVERARLEEVRASRARLVEAADAARRKLERDLHDGAQQWLVTSALNLRLARSRLEHDPQGGLSLLDEAIVEIERATRDLREIAHGLHPALLTDRGLGAALQTIANRSPIPVDVSAQTEQRLPPSVETATYFVVSEALTNVFKHAAASEARVRVVGGRRDVTVEVEDDGLGGADLSAGLGLRGLEDRVAALDGRLTVRSPDGGGTLVSATIPFTPPPAEPTAPVSGGVARSS